MSKELVPLNQELVADDAEVVDGELVDESTGFLVETWRDNEKEIWTIRVEISNHWVRDVPREWIDEVGVIRDRLFELARRRPSGGI